MIGNWQTKKLGEICDIYQPKTISSKEMIFDGKYVVFGANGIIGRYDKYNHEEPQLLITCRGATCGSVNISEPKSWITGNAMVIRPKDLSILNIKYLEYIFRGGFDISKVITGAAQPQITRKSLDPIEISYPESLQEQRRIVKIINEAFGSIAKAKENAEKNLQNTSNLYLSFQYSVFLNDDKRWNESKLGTIADLIDSLHTTPKYNDEGVPMVRVTDIKQGILNLSQTKKVTNSTYEEFSKRHKPKKGDIVFSRVGSYGVSSYVNSDEPFCLGQNTVFIVPKEDSKFIFYFLGSPNSKEQIDRLVAGTTQPTISLKSIKEIIVPCPSKKEKQQIIEKIDFVNAEIKKLESVYQQKLTDIEELKKSILNKAFRGNL